MTDPSTDDEKVPKERLKLTKRELADLPPEEHETESVKGGFTPPYVPVGPVHRPE